MKRARMRLCRSLMALLLASAAIGATARPALDLAAYSDEAGVITTLHQGPASDPYFALQALLLAHDNGLDIAQPAARFADWLVMRQKPDGTFDRFCRTADGPWSPCKTADADDSLLALWMRLLLTMPAHVQARPALRRSQDVSMAALEHLYQPSRGVYMVSPVTLHGLFMDNLEVWSLHAAAGAARQAQAAKLAAAIRATFWDPVNRRFIVSTQLEQRAQPAAFYPDHVAQLFPQLVNLPVLPTEAGSRYADWMRRHRKEWLQQGANDYPWGIIAVLALRRGDTASAACWLREAGPLRHSTRWAVTDEASYQVLAAKGLKAAAAGASCH